MIMNISSKLLLYVDGLMLAFYLGFCHGKRTKRRKRRNPVGTSSKKRTNQNLQIEVNLENNIVGNNS